VHCFHGFLGFQVDQLSTFPLEELYLSNNLLEAIEEETFSELSQLRVLDISSNIITGRPLRVNQNETACCVSKLLNWKSSG